VRSTNWIGDVVMISPALAALRRHYAGARIEVVATPVVAECLRGDPSVDDLIVFERRGRHAGVSGLLRFARQLRGRRFDLSVLFPKAIGAALMAWLARIPVRIGLATDRRGWLLTHPVPFCGGLAERHHLEIFLEVARAAGCAIDDPSPSFHLGDEDLAWADAFLSERSAGRFPFLLALHVGASKRPRGWHRERFAEAAMQIAESRDGGVVLLGAKGDQEEMDQVAARLGTRALNACGRSTIKQMAALIARCSLFLGNDSGPMHLAGALGVPVVAIFGPGDPERTAPRTPRGSEGSVITVSRRYPCSPCRQVFFRECYPSPAGKPMCLESIGVDEVVGAAGALLAGSAEP
jgi:heptosyltransferase-2